MGEAVEGMDKRDKILQSGGHRPRLLYNYRLSFRANRTGAGVGWQISGEKIKQLLASLKESPPPFGCPRHREGRMDRRGRAAQAGGGYLLSSTWQECFLSGVWESVLHAGLPWDVFKIKGAGTRMGPTSPSS